MYIRHSSNNFERYDIDKCLGKASLITHAIREVSGQAEDETPQRNMYQYDDYSSEEVPVFPTHTHGSSF